MESTTATCDVHDSPINHPSLICGWANLCHAQDKSIASRKLVSVPMRWM
jgi:hypothetical protein